MVNNFLYRGRSRFEAAVSARSQSRFSGLSQRRFAEPDLGCGVPVEILMSGRLRPVNFTCVAFRRSNTITEQPVGAGANLPGPRGDQRRCLMLPQIELAARSVRAVPNELGHRRFSTPGPR